MDQYPTNQNLGKPQNSTLLFRKILIICDFVTIKLNLGAIVLLDF